ncbi:hypothetical protein [Haloplanus halobius]|uniref:hypothetical protein n=1 Tax=Haloplanus halobius TaxID=2934938 RepID=UPI00200D196E|nr:hypothetical protein [Haloplanus sp. XH21]
MVESHAPDTPTDSRIYVNGTRLPAGNVDCHLRKEGNLDFTRYVEGEFASPFRGGNYTDAFNGLAPEDQDGFDVVRLDVRDYETERYTTVFRGYVTGVGNSSNEPEQRWRFRAQGPGHLLDNIPASKRFTDATITDVATYITENLNEKLPFPVVFLETLEDVVQEGDTVRNVESANDDASPSDYAFPIARIFSDLVASLTDNIHTPHTFQANRDTLADVASWLKDKSNVEIWLTPTDEGVGLVVARGAKQRHEAHYLGGDTQIVNNDALVELRPVNTKVVKGGAKESQFSVGPLEINSPTDTFTTAKARHKPLYRRAGQRELHANTETKTGALSKEEVGNEAKSLLKQAIEGTTEGTMQTLLRGPIAPFDTVEARPTCNERVSASDESITYEVSRVHHKIRTGDEMSSTELNVGVHVGDDDITIIDSWESEA